jgi:RNAse (barnase) inhibitor barstar
MHRISLNAAGWRTTDDFYTDLLSALKAPAWHGRSLDALWDTLTERAKFDDLTAYINGVQPPFRIDVRNVHLASEAVRTFLPKVERLFALANSEHAVGVAITLWSTGVLTESAELRPDNSPS